MNKENAADYDDMLLYIRLTSAKSEMETEEILLELLEHTLEAQKEGKTIKDIFGNDLKAYCQSLIEEIPEQSRNKRIKFSLRIMFLFLAVTSFLYGFIHIVLYYLFSIGSSSTTFYLGTSVTVLIIDLFVLWFVIFFILSWIKSSLFKEYKKKTSKWLNFLTVWLIMSVSIVLYIVAIHITPAFGPTFSVPTITFIVIGITLYGISYVLKDKT